ncbi:MAG: hypothetical protein R2883_04675 [Caldisericia bacterium]
MRNGESEFLFNFGEIERKIFGFTYKTGVGINVCGDKFLVHGNLNSIFLANRAGEIERVFTSEKTKEGNLIEIRNNIEPVIGNHFIISSRRVLPNTPETDYEQTISREMLCYNANNNCLYQSQTDAFHFVPNAYTNYCNPDVIVTGEYNNDDKNNSKQILYKAIDLSRGSEVELITRNSADFRKKVKFFEVAGDVVAFQNNEDSNYTICDALTGKNYTFENTDADINVSLSTDRFLYIRDGKVFSKKYSFITE